MDPIDQFSGASTTQVYHASYAYIQDWMGRGVNWVNAWEPKLQENPHLAAAALVGANMVIFQLAFRIAHLINPDDSYIRSDDVRGIELHVGGLGLALYGVGILGLTMAVNTSFSGWQLSALHTAGFVASLGLTGLIHIVL